MTFIYQFTSLLIILRPFSSRGRKRLGSILNFTTQIAPNTSELQLHFALCNSILPPESNLLNGGWWQRASGWEGGREIGSVMGREEEGREGEERRGKEEVKEGSSARKRWKEEK